MRQSKIDRKQRKIGEDKLPEEGTELYLFCTAYYCTMGVEKLLPSIIQQKFNLKSNTLRTLFFKKIVANIQDYGRERRNFPS